MSEPNRLVQAGARAATRDFLDYLNDHENTDSLDARHLRAWLYAYWITSGGVDAQG